MSEFIINCIQSGAYSAVFAVLLFYIVKSGIRREKHYQAFIAELCAGLKEINAVSGKLDGLIELAEKSVRKKEKSRPADFAGAVGAYAEERQPCAFKR